MDPRVSRAIDHMHTRMGEPLTLRTLAGELGLSYSRFAHLFRAEVGVPPMRYLQELRLARALALIERTTLPVREVMVTVGYHDPSHFARDFKRRYGRPPRDVRPSRRSLSIAVAANRSG